MKIVSFLRRLDKSIGGTKLQLPVQVGKDTTGDSNSMMMVLNLISLMDKNSFVRGDNICNAFLSMDNNENIDGDDVILTSVSDLETQAEKDEAALLEAAKTEFNAAVEKFKKHFADKNTKCTTDFTAFAAYFNTALAAAETKIKAFGAKVLEMKTNIQNFKTSTKTEELKVVYVEGAIITINEQIKLTQETIISILDSGVLNLMKICHEAIPADIKKKMTDYFKMVCVEINKMIDERDAQINIIKEKARAMLKIVMNISLLRKLRLRLLLLSARLFLRLQWSVEFSKQLKHLLKNAVLRLPLCRQRWRLMLYNCRRIHLRSPLRTILKKC
jgi:intracellular sulfur oxidation DsrE/DsrF family protein